MDLELRHLRAYLAVAEERNYTRAAHRLHMTQPSLTRTIQQLERVLDCRLIERTSRRFALTDDGEQFLTAARRIVADLDAAVADLQLRSAVSIGFSWLLPDAWFAAARTRFEALGGHVQIHRIDDPISALLSGTIDIALFRKDIRLPAQLATRVIATERRVLAVSAHSPLARARFLNWNDVARYPLVVNTITGTTDETSWPTPRPARPVVTCTNFDEWIELIAADRGIGAVPELARHRAPHPGVVYLDVPDAPPSQVHLVWRVTPAPPRSVQRFLDVA
ncbi:LysR family transcriptional regulator [Nocardia sp. CDC159]|uniref:LysR family transcriptional regulator n=1 Tax=Nocardia pulmonis TaxID=2951408 RepID=A0A9X2EC16_9NOCA|nr:MULTISPECIES: LysR family transcriptional regulator [Nocardia]MCM6776715.1 LysR family transcriptional regulator [Nocardia pulmonis]MCM6789136.1 LysR family transcriptional regulator [Nocardia sp. CDC159]